MDLLVAYGYPEGNSGAGWNANNGYPSTSITGVEKIRPDFVPMYFVRSGILHLPSGSLRAAGLDSIYWSSTAYPGSTTRADHLHINLASVFPSGYNARYRGMSIRCLAK